MYNIRYYIFFFFFQVLNKFILSIQDNYGYRLTDTGRLFGVIQWRVLYYLQHRFLPISGNHGALTVRALLAHEQSIKCVANAVQVLETLKNDYSKLLVDFGIEHDPLVLENVVDNIKSGPTINIGQIFILWLVKSLKQNILNSANQKKHIPFTEVVLLIKFLLNLLMLAKHYQIICNTLSKN